MAWTSKSYDPDWLDFHKLLNTLPIKNEETGAILEFDEWKEMIKVKNREEDITLYKLEYFFDMGPEPAQDALQELIDMIKKQGSSKARCYPWDHKWKQYHGFREIYEFCEICDVKKEDLKDED